MNRWLEMQRSGSFESDKAQLSMLALPQYLPGVKAATMEEAMQGKTPLLSTVKKYQGEGVAIASVKHIIGEASTLVNVGRNLTPQQVEFLAEEIIAQYFYLTLADIRFVMRQGVTGKYGELYERLDVQVVSGWFAQYVSERLDAAESKSSQKKPDAGDGNAVHMPQWFTDFLRKFEVKEEPKSDFIPDANFWKMVEDEWKQSPEPRMELEKFKTMRLAQTKALFSR